MHHKRGRPKNRRSGCLMCKPHKMNGFSCRAVNMTHGNRRRAEEARSRLKEGRAE